MKKPEVLVIDENTKVLFAFEAVLAREGCVTISAENLAEGLKKLSGNRPNAVFLDVSETQKVNYKVLQKIRDMDPTIPLILLTSHLTKEVEERYMEYNVNGYLEKPLSIEKVREVLRRLNIRSGG
jgi:DNA-binding NtrC family response regulator